MIGLRAIPVLINTRAVTASSFKCSIHTMKQPITYFKFSCVIQNSHPPGVRFQPGDTNEGVSLFYWSSHLLSPPDKRTKWPSECFWE